MTNNDQPLTPHIVDLSVDGSYKPLLEGVPVSCGMRSGHVTLAPGESCGLHSTGQHEEVLVFLAGQGRAEADGHEPLQVGAGKIAYIPPQTEHNVYNTSTEGVLSYVYVVAPVTGDGAAGDTA